MTLALIGFVFAAVLCAVAFHANKHFRRESSLPMQWCLGGHVTWYAPRRIALAFFPAISIVMLLGFGVLNTATEPRPGQEEMVIPAYIFIGLILLGAQLFHIWMAARTLERIGR